jgi:hypothetical protein
VGEGGSRLEWSERGAVGEGQAVVLGNGAGLVDCIGVKGKRWGVEVD